MTNDALFNGFIESVCRMYGKPEMSSYLVEGFNSYLTALLEDAAGTAQHKTRNVIRKLFPRLATKLDDIAVDENGQPLLTASGKEQKFIDMLEHRIRNEFFHDGSNIRFEPGVARIAYGELGLENRNEDSRKIASLKKIVKLISDGHADEYDANLNGMSYSDLETRFGNKVQSADEAERSALAAAEYEKSDYVIEEIPDYETATKYAEFTSPYTWCITHMDNMWDSYTAGGTNKVYFAHKPGFESLRPAKGPACPLDEYGLSLISIIVDPWGNLRAVTTRWNHENGGSDQAMDARQVSEVLGGNVFELCPPPPKPEQHIERVGDNAVKIGDQVWMCRNLSAEPDENHGIYVNPDNGETYFNWTAAVREAEKYPGWRLPTRNDWKKLVDFCGGEDKAGLHLKSRNGWDAGGFDTYGFSAVPAGYWNHGFDNVGSSASFWTSEPNGGYAWNRYIDTGTSVYESNNDQYYGFSVRLVQDSP